MVLFTNIMAGFKEVVLCVFLFSLLGKANCSENDCIGSNCFCTEYPVWIMCVNGYPDYIPKMMKRVAVGLELDGDGPEDVRKFELSDFLSLKNVDVKIADNEVCEWIYENTAKFPDVKISGPPYCKEKDDGEMTITVGEIIAWIMTSLGLIAMVMLRKKIK